MMKYLWSALNNAFFPDPLIKDYELAGWDISDVVEVSSDVFAKFSASIQGKVRVVGADKMPAWADLPPPTPEQLIAAAEQKKQLMLAHANAVTADWRTELALGIISDEDKAKLTIWMQYIRDVKAVDTSTVTTWPEMPE